MRRRLALGLVILAGIVAVSSALRVGLAFRDPNFDAARPEGMLKSDPALLYYFTKRILAAGGGVPADFAADPRVQYPATTDIPAEFTVGQEFLTAWAYRAFGGGEPLHAFCVRLMAVCASLAAVGVWLVAFARTRCVGWSTLAVLLFALLPASYRTIGFILVREDVSFPLFALHLGLLAFAERQRRWPLFLASGLALGAALATWHAMSFFVLVEVGVLVVGFLGTGKNPLAIPGALATLVGPVLAGLFVPALQASGFLFGPAMIGVGGLVVAAIVPHLRETGRSALTLSAPAFWGLAVLVKWIARSGPSAYAHVYEVLGAKLLHLGVKPADPTAISFDARLLWQGPFETLPPETSSPTWGGGPWPCS